MQFKGLGVHNKYFSTQNKQMYIRLHCLRVLWNLSTCFPNLKIILQSGPSVFKFNLKRTVIFLHKNFRVCNRSKQGELVPTHDFWHGIPGHDPARESRKTPLEGSRKSVQRERHPKFEITLIRKTRTSSSDFALKFISYPLKTGTTSS